ncbi:MAG: hypothetical protein ACK413_02535 [Patescibacteria group bacterium]
MIIITFIVIIFLWQIYLKIFQSKEKKEPLFKDLEKNFKDLLDKMKKIKLPDIETILKNIEKKESQQTITNQEIERLKEKILEYINKEEK